MAAPGFYPDPSGQPHLREWDGQQWTANTKAYPAPVQAPPAPSPLPVAPTAQPVAAPKADNSWGWALAFAPLLISVSSGLLLSAGHSDAGGLGLAIAIGINVALCLLDARRLRAGGHPVKASAFFIPYYLFQRSKITGQSHAMLAVWCVTLLLSFGVDAIISSQIVDMDMTGVESSISEDVDNAQVDCPSQSAWRVGAHFTCTVATSDGGTYDVDVTIDDSDGRFTYLPAG